MNLRTISSQFRVVTVDYGLKIVTQPALVPEYGPRKRGNDWQEMSIKIENHVIDMVNIGTVIEVPRNNIINLPKESINHLIQSNIENNLLDQIEHIASDLMLDLTKTKQIYHVHTKVYERQLQV